MGDAANAAGQNTQQFSTYLDQQGMSIAGVNEDFTKLIDTATAPAALESTLSNLALTTMPAFNETVNTTTSTLSTANDELERFLTNAASADSLINNLTG